MEHCKILNIFGEDITHMMEADLKHQRRSEAAKRGAETRRINKEKKLQRLQSAFNTIHTPINLFGEVRTEEEYNEAKQYIEENKHLLKKKKK